MLKKIKILSLLLFGYLFTYTQTQSNHQFIENLIEEIAENNEGEIDYTLISEDLYYYLDHPINLNNDCESELEKLKILNAFQVSSLLNYIKSSGKMNTLYELQLVEGFDQNTIRKIVPFIQLSATVTKENWSAKQALKHGKHTIMSRYSTTLETSHGYKERNDSLGNLQANKYPGNAARVYSKYKFNYKNKMQWGLTVEKDPGEQFAKGAQKNGFDFYSAHLQISDAGIINKAIIGDFQAQFGQGLIMWSYLSNGKSSYVMNIRKRAKGIHRYASTDENAYLRGAALTIGKKQLLLTAFASHKAFDANVVIADSINNSYEFTSFLNSGIHATSAEIEDNNAVKESTLGANITWQHNIFKVGVSGLQYRFNIPYATKNEPQNQFLFSGTTNSNLSFDAEIRLKKIHFFGESALSENGGTATIVGALMELNSQFRTSVLYRNYAKNYQAKYSNAFAEGSRTQNETGIYLGAEISPVKKWRISTYFDFYKFPWLTSNTSAPAKGDDFLLQAEYAVSRNLHMYWRYKNENKQEDNNLNQSAINRLTTTNKGYIRYQVNYKPFVNWEFRNRVEISKYKPENSSGEQGYLLLQDVIYRPSQNPLTLVLRYAVFDTESYHSRIYTYESDVLYAYSVPALYNKGSRSYLLVQYQISNNIDIWMRIAQTWYANKTEIGSGTNLIEGDTKSDIKFQFRWKF